MKMMVLVLLLDYDYDYDIKCHGADTKRYCYSAWSFRNS